MDLSRAAFLLVLAMAFMALHCSASTIVEEERFISHLVDEIRELEYVWVKTQNFEDLSVSTEADRELIAREWFSLLGADTLAVVQMAKAELLEDPDRYNTTAYHITMHDGVQLFTVVSFPNLDGIAAPVVLDRTPYSTTAYQPINIALFTHLGYVVATQDMRGCYNSGGDWSYWRHSARDGSQTIEWLAAQTFSTGDVVTWGASADGIAASTIMLHKPTPPPSLKAYSLWVASSDGYETTYEGGAYRQGLISNWLKGLDFEYFIETIWENERFSPWWDPIEMADQWGRTNLPALHSGGWYDIFSEGTIEGFNNIQYNGGEGAKGQQWLVMNPFGHCFGGEYTMPMSRNLWMLGLSYQLFAEVTDLPSPSAVSMPGPLSGRKHPDSLDGWLPINFYVMAGSEKNAGRDFVGNFWACMYDWPSITHTDYYLTSSGQLSTSPSGAMAANSTYIYDPLDPVPTLGGNNLYGTCGPYDQSSLEERDDVIVFTSDPLTEPVAITGKVSATVFVSSNCTDTDFTAKLTDVYDGKSYNILDNIIRMRWRDSNTDVTLMEPGLVYEVTIELQTTSYVFNAGHQIRLDISSSNYDRFSTNLNNGNLIIDGGEPLVAQNTLFHDVARQSRLSLPIVSLDELEANECNY